MQSPRGPALVLLLLLVGALAGMGDGLAARVWVNQPTLGGQLEMLVENESADAPLVLRRPDGVEENLSWVEGQLTHPIDQAGHWEARMGERRWSWEIPPAGDGASAGGAGTPPIAGLAGVGFGAALLLLLALIALGGYLLVLRAPQARSPQLEKRRGGGQIQVRLRAGTRPLSEVRLIDHDGERARELKRERLAAGEVLEIHYPDRGKTGWAEASFRLSGQTHRMRAGADSTQAGVLSEPRPEGTDPENEGRGRKRLERGS